MKQFNIIQIPILFILIVTFSKISIKKHSLSKSPRNYDIGSQTPPEEMFSWEDLLSPIPSFVHNASSCYVSIFILMGDTVCYGCYRQVLAFGFQVLLERKKDQM